MPELGELQLRTLVPLGEIDVARQVMPQYKDTVTGQTGELSELSREPGALWNATWMPGQPWYARKADGGVLEVRPEGAD